IFDEIDTGVSGKTSRKIGFLMKNVSKGSQIICITHSAQIASLADTHLLVSKKEVEGRTTSVVLPLEGEERVAEIARILGGISVTEAQKMAAADMLSGKE
ncbi:MAG: DNA repair protein RecN, partial [Clostridia bacterium]|nr:DNA repair protein RecN [Clostridia bacterium]